MPTTILSPGLTALRRAARHRAATAGEETYLLMGCRGNSVEGSIPIARTSKLPSESKAPANSADLLAAAVYLRPAWGIRSESSCDRGRFWSGFSCGGVQCRRIVKEYEHGLQRDGLVS